MARERQYLKQQANVNSQTGNVSGSMNQQSISNTNTSSTQNQLTNAGNHSKKNSQSNIFSYRKSPQSQLNDIVHQSRVQQNLGQKGIDARYQKDNQQNQQHNQQDGYQQIYNHDKNVSKGDIVGKFQNGFKHFNQMIQNVDRESNLQKEQQQLLLHQQQLQSQQQQLNQFSINNSNSNNYKRLNSPAAASSTLQLQGQSVSHRQSVVGNNIEELKQSVIQGLANYQYQNQDSEIQQNIHQNIYSQTSNGMLANKSNSNVNNNYDPNENLFILASKLSEIAQNFSSPGKKLNTASSANYANNTNIPQSSAMKSSNMVIQHNNNNQQYSQSMQSSRHASGNLYAATSSSNQLQSNQQTYQQQQQQQGKQQNGLSNQNNLKYSQINTLSQNLNYQAQNSSNNNQQQMYDQIQDQYMKHFSPSRYVINEYGKQPNSSLATSITNTQKKPQQQIVAKQNQNLNGIYQDMQGNQINSNQELKPFITDRVVYNQKDNQNISKNQLESNLQSSNFANKQQRKGAFNNNITKKKRQEMKEYRHFSSIDFKNSEQNSLINQQNHNVSTQNNVNNTVSHNISQIRNISQIAMNQNAKNLTSVSAANTSRQQKVTTNQNAIQSANPLISVEQKIQLMQANKLINSLQSNTNASSIINTNGSYLQENGKIINQDTLQINHIAPNPSAQSTMANPTQYNQLGTQNSQQNQSINNKNNNANQLTKMNYHNSSQSQLLQKLENSPNSNLPSRLSNRNNNINSNNNTQRNQSNLAANKISNQNLTNQNIQQNNTLNSGNSSSQLNQNTGKSSNSLISNSKNKYSLYLLQPSHSPGHQNSNSLLQNQVRVQSATNNSSNASNQNKLTSNIHNTNTVLQNNYLLSQKPSKISNPANNSASSGNNSLGKLTQNLFGNLSIINSHLNQSNGNVNNLANLNATNSPNTYSENNQNSTNNLNIKIQKQLQQQQPPQQQQFNLLTSSIGQYKKQGGPTSIGGVQQPLSAKSTEQMIKERRKHSESTAIHSHSANNSNLMMITNLSQGKQFEEDFIKEQQSASFYKNVQVATTKNSLKSSIIQQEGTTSQPSTIKTKLNQQLSEQMQLLNLEKEKIIQKNQIIMINKNSSKTPERERYPFNISSSSSRKIEVLKQSKTPKERVGLNQNSSPNSLALEISQNKDLIKNYSKLKFDERQILNNKSIVKNMQNNIINYQNYLQQHKQAAALDNQHKTTEDHQNQALQDYMLEDEQHRYQFAIANQKGINDLQQQYNNQQIPLGHEIMHQNFMNEDPSNINNNVLQDDITNLVNQQNVDCLQTEQEEQKIDQIIKNQNTFDQPNYSISSSQIQKFNQIQDQSSNIQTTNPNQQLSDSNHIGSSEVSSKINNSHNSFFNPINNSFYNQIKLQTIDSMIIPHPSQVLHTGMTADKVSAQAYQINQPDESIGDYHEYADYSNALINSQGMNQNNIRSISPQNSLQGNKFDNHNYQLELKNNLKQQNSAYIQQGDDTNNINNINDVYSGVMNMQNLEQAIQHQQGRQDKLAKNNQEGQNYLLDNQTNSALWREKSYRQQEQDLKKYENLNQFSKQAQKQQANNSTEKEILNKNLQDDANKKSSKNLKQQLEEINSMQNPVLQNILADKGEKRKYIFQESSDKKRNQTPNSQTNKAIPSHNTQQTSASKVVTQNNQFKNSQEEIQNQLNSSVKKSQKSNLQSSPTSKYSKIPNFQQYEPSITKNNPQIQQAQPQQQPLTKAELSNNLSQIQKSLEDSQIKKEQFDQMIHINQQFRDQQDGLNSILKEQEYQDNNAISSSNNFQANLIQKISDHRHKINAIAYNSQDNIIFTASHDYNLKAFTSSSNEQQDFYCFQNIRHKRWVTSLEYIFSLNILLSGGADGLVKLFKIENNQNDINSNSTVKQFQNEQFKTNIKLEQFMKGHCGTVTGIKCLNDQNLVSSGSDGIINLYDLETLQIIQNFNQNSMISSIEWLPQNNLLVNINERNLSLVDIRDNKIALQTQNSDFSCLKRLDYIPNSFLVGTGQYYNQQANQISKNSPSVLLLDLRYDINQPSSIFKPYNGTRVNCIEVYEDKNVCILGTDQSLESINLISNEGNIIDSQKTSVKCISVDNIHHRIYTGCQNNDLRIYKTF